jgi:hypothetical protein
MRRHGAALNVLVTVAEEEKIKWWRRGVMGISFLGRLCCVVVDQDRRR